MLEAFYQKAKDAKAASFAWLHWGTKGILLFFQKTRTLQSRAVVTLFHLFTIAI